MRNVLQLVCLLAVILGFAAPRSVFSQVWEEDQVGVRSIDQPVERGRDALAAIPQANWYDGESDDVRGVTVPGETKMPDSRPGAPPKPKAPAAPSNWPTWNWSPSLGGLSIGSILLYGLLFLILAVVAYLIFRAIQSGGPVRSSSAVEEDLLDDKSRQIDRVEHLPFEVKKKDGNLLDEARRCYEAGNFNEAIVYLFSFQLLELDKGHVIRLTKGKTNGQYLREAGGNRNLRQILQQTMNAFEDVFFGNRNRTRERFERCWKQISQFDQLLAGGKI